MIISDLIKIFDLKIFFGVLIILAALFYFWEKRRSLKTNQYASKNGTPTLDRFSRDLTRAAREGKIDLLIGREDEIKRIIRILSRRTKNNAILVGEAGSGKTAMAEGLALAVVNKQVPPILQNKRVLALDLGGMLAGTQYRGEFEQRMMAVTDELARSGRQIILFIDEIQNLTQAGESVGAIGAANLLKPALARGEVQAVGACTVEDYYKYIVKDTSLERRFQPVMVSESNPDETFKILQGIKSKYEKHHQVKISDEILKTVVNLCLRYMAERSFPDKAIDVIDEAASKVRLEYLGKTDQTEQNWPSVSEKDIQEVIFQWGSDLSALKKKGEFLEKQRVRIV